MSTAKNLIIIRQKSFEQKKQQELFDKTVSREEIEETVAESGIENVEVRFTAQHAIFFGEAKEMHELETVFKEQFKKNKFPLDGIAVK
jgi:hypothetical protein